MLIFSDRGLAFLATPKTGSTAIELALRGKADVIFRARRKHVNATKFRNQIAPFMAKSFGVDLTSVALMRDPVDQLRSWYKYRSRSKQAGEVTSTAGISFDDFIKALMSDDPPPFTQVGSQQGFLLLRDGSLGVDHLFQYERMEVFLEYLEDRLGFPVTPDVKNVSPPIEAPLSADLAEALRAHKPEEFALYDRLSEAGGVLHQS